MQNKENDNIDDAVKKALETGRNTNDNFNEDEARAQEKFPDDESQVIFTDLQGIRRRGIYRKDQGFMEIAETEIPRKEQYFYPEEDIAQWEYEPESQSE